MSFRFLSAALLACSVLTGVRAADPEQELEALQKKMLGMLLNGNPSPDELKGMVAELNKLLLKDAPELQPLADLLGQLPLDGKPANPPAQLQNLFKVLPQLAMPQGRQLPDFPPPFRQLGLAPQPNELPPPGEVSDKRLKEFDEQIEKLKDNPEAQAELRKARDEYKKTLDAEMRKGGVQRPKEEARPQPRLQFRVAPPVDILEPLLRNRPNLARPRGPVRLGVVFEKPPALLTEHLNLPAEVGVVVVEVLPGSVAEKAGLKVNDVLVKLGGKDAPSELTRFQELVADLKGGAKHEAVVYRKGKKETIGGIQLPGTDGR